MLIILRTKREGKQIIVNLDQVCYISEEDIGGGNTQTVLHYNNYNIMVDESPFKIANMKNVHIENYN